MELSHSLAFLKCYVRNPNRTGTIAPSSRALARAVCEPFRRHHGPACVLECGAGTGAITKYIGSILEDGDELDICEIESELADILEREVLSTTIFAQARERGHVRLLRQPVQEIPFERRYDFVICGLPLSAFELKDVHDVFSTVRRCLKPGGIFSYYEYIGLRRTSRNLAIGRRRKRIRSVSAFLSENIRRHQFAHQTVLQNLPPARARHLRFEQSMGPQRGLRVPSTYDGQAAPQTSLDTQGVPVTTT